MFECPSWTFRLHERIILERVVVFAARQNDESFRHEKTICPVADLPPYSVPIVARSNFIPEIESVRRIVVDIEVHHGDCANNCGTYARVNDVHGTPV